jgi:iron complex outermembrane receptor protein
MGRKPPAWRRALEKGLVLLVLSAAAGGRFAAANVAQAALAFDLESGPLGGSLIEIAKRSGTIVSFNPALVDGRVAAPVQGRFTPLQAFEQALRGTDLALEVTADGAVTLRRRPAAAVQSLPAQSGTALQALASAPAAAASGSAPAPTASRLPPVLVLGQAERPDEVGLRPVAASTATRTDTPLSELPQAVSVITRDALELQGANATTTDALRYVTGVTAQVSDSGQGLAPTVMVRGMPASYSLSGMRTLRGGLAIDNAFVERIEVLKGPSGVVGGVADFGGRGGVVNLVRKSIDTQEHLEFSQTLGSRDSGTLRLEVDAAGEVMPRTYWRAVAFGSRSGRTDGGYDPQHAGGLLAAVGYRGADFKATLTVQADRRRTAPARASLGGTPADNGLSPLSPDAERPVVNRADGLWWQAKDVEIDLDWRLSPQWRMSWKGRVETVEGGMRHHRYWEPNESIGFVDLLQRSTRARDAGMQWGLVGNLATGPVAHRLLMAVDLERWRLHRGDGAATWVVDPAAYEPGITPLPATPDEGDAQSLSQRTLRERKHALLLQDQLRLGSWIARLAVQRTHSPEYFDEIPRQGPRATNWDAGLLYQLTPSASIYAGAQYSVELDGRTDDLQLHDGSSAPYRRERQSQVGTKLDLLERRLAFTLEAFRLRQLDTLQGSSALPGNGLFAIPGRSTDGIDAELAGRVLPALDLHMGLSYMRARETVPGPEEMAPLGVELPATGVPARSMHVLARYRLSGTQAARHSLGFGFRAFSSSWAAPPNPFDPDAAQLRLPGGAQLDLSWTRATEQWSLGVAVENVFDRRLYGTQPSPGYIPLQPGRGVSLTAQISL